MLKIKKENEEPKFSEVDIMEGTDKGDIKTIEIDRTIEFIRVIREMTEVATMSCYVIKLISTGEREVIEGQIDLITRGIEVIREILMRYMPGVNESVKGKRRTVTEEIKPVERFELDVIPMLRFYELKSKINTIIDGYEEMSENMTYEETCEMNTDLKRIENSLDNIGMQLANKLKTDLIYKEDK